MAWGEQRIRFQPSAIDQDGFIDVVRKVVEKAGEQEAGTVYIGEWHAPVHGLENVAKRFNGSLPAVRSRIHAFGLQKRQLKLRLKMVRITCGGGFKGLQSSVNAPF